MSCWGRTKRGGRCKNSSGRLLPFCKQHRWQPVLSLVAICGVLATFAGLFQDLIKPIYSHFSENRLAETQSQGQELLKSITVNLKISQSYSGDLFLKPEIEYFLIKSKSPSSQQVVESGVARIEIPEDLITIRNRIPLKNVGVIETRCELPANALLREALSQGGYELQLIISTTRGETLRTPEQRIFDARSLQDGFSFHVFPSYIREVQSEVREKELVPQ